MPKIPRHPSTLPGWAALSAAIFLTLLTGCQTVKLPVVMNDNPTLGELLGAVNANSTKVTTLRSDNASVGMSNLSGWVTCRVAYQKPQNLRLIGTAPMSGKVVDFGCNGDKFWFWSQFQDSDKIFWSPLGEYTNSPMKEAIPVDPVWFPDALGVTEINNAEVIEGPIVQADKSILLVTQRQRSDGIYRKNMFIEPRTAAIKRQDIIGPNGDTVVSVTCNEFQVDDATKAVLPKKMVITCPKADASLQFDLGKVQVNQPDGITPELFAMPTQNEINAQQVNIGASSVPSVAPAQDYNPPAVQMTAPAPPPMAETQPPLTTTPAQPAAVPEVPAFNGGDTQFTPPVSGTEIPVSGPQTTQGEPSVTAEFRSIASQGENRYTNDGQSYFVPPAD